MATSASRLLKRLAKELQGLRQEKQRFGIKVKIFDTENLVGKPWRAYLRGPVDTPYEGCTFALDIMINMDYPFKPPTVMFVNRCWHPNIGVNGHVCVDILQKSWAPSLSIYHVLQSVQSMLDDPDPTSPLNAEAANMWIRATRSGDKTAYAAVVRANVDQRYVLNEEERRFDDDSPALQES